MISRWKNSVGARIMVMVAVSILLLIPNSMIQGLIAEREMTRNEAVAEVSSKWGSSQVIAGPILSIPLKKYIRDEKGRVTSACIRYAHFLPDDLTINGTITPYMRHRGIYDIALYNGKLDLAGSFPFPEIDGMVNEGEEVLWNDASLSVGITDMKGIKEAIRITWDKTSLIANPGIESGDVLAAGVSVPVKIDKQTRQYPFSFRLDLNGSQELRFLPFGKETHVTLSSSWTAPSFQGSFLPENREVTKDGFTAEWKVLQLNRNYPQKWEGKRADLQNSAFGVNFFMPVDQYQKTSRSLKYSLLFIGLTFTAYFVIELLNRKSMHPIHYLLIGIALVLFYTLLLSLSEHIGFDYSYLAASICTILLLTGYTKSVLSNRIISFTVFAILTLLYGFLYVLLQVEDYALLIGSIGLFTILGSIMYITRKINWYSAIKSDVAENHA